MEIKKVGVSAVAAVVVIIVAVGIGAGVYFLIGTGGNGEENAGGGGGGATISLVYDDFNDGTLGTNLGGNAGAMSPDGLYDPTINFTTGADAYGGAYALSLQYDFPSDQWCGYWSFFNASESGYDVSGYTALVMWAKGAAGGEKFKVELKDTTDAMSAVYITSISGFSEGLTTGWQKITIPLTSFSGVDLTSIKQVNIVFDTSPHNGTVYLDQIGFG